MKQEIEDAYGVHVPVIPGPERPGLIEAIGDTKDKGREFIGIPGPERPGLIEAARRSSPTGERNWLIPGPERPGLIEVRSRRLRLSPVAVYSGA